MNAPNKIRIYREEIGLSQEELANKAGVSRATISGLETGTATSTTTTTIVKIAEALGKSPNEIFF